MNLNLNKVLKYKKYYLPKNKGLSIYKLNFGNWAIQSLETKYISINEFNTLKKDILFFFKNSKFIYINKFFHMLFTFKTSESRMGGGKGNIIKTFIFFKKNTIICEIKNIINNKNIINSINIISSKLSFQIRILKLKI